MKFPGRKPCHRCVSGVSQITKWSRDGVGQIYHPAPTNHAARIRTAKSPSGRQTAGARLRDQLTSATNLPTASRTLATSSACSRGCWPFSVLNGTDSLIALDDAGAGNPERLAGLVVRPDPAVLAERSPDHGQRLALQGAVAERPGQPVDRVLDHGRDAAVVFRGHHQGGIGFGRGGPQRGHREPGRPRRSSRRRSPRCRTAARRGPRRW